MSGETVTDQSAGIFLDSPTTQNPLLVAGKGQVIGGGYGVYGAAGYAWTVDNQGAIYGTTAVVLNGGGSLINGGSGEQNALIRGQTFGVSIAGGSVTNYGKIESSDSAIFQSGNGVIFNAGRH